MSVEKVRKYLAQWGKEDEVREFDASSATRCNPARGPLQTQPVNYVNPASPKADREMYFKVCCGTYLLN